MYTPGESPDTPRKREALAVPTEAEKMPSVGSSPPLTTGAAGELAAQIEREAA